MSDIPKKRKIFGVRIAFVPTYYLIGIFMKRKKTNLKQNVKKKHPKKSLFPEFYNQTGKCRACLA